MNPHDPTDDNSKSDQMDATIRAALIEDGAIIPGTMEEVREAKAKLEAFPVTVPKHLQDPSAILARIEAVDQLPEAGSMERVATAGGFVSRGSHRASDEFVEAVAIAHLTRLVAEPDYPLGRKRCQKLTYLSHRKTEDDVSQRFLKKAAGPYSPWARYKGPEAIALKNGYVRRGKVGRFEGLLVGDKIDRIDDYVPRYSICAAIEWVVSKFRYHTNDELELLATVDFAALDLKQAHVTITLDAVRRVIGANKEWRPKLNRAVFSDENIQRALDDLKSLFPATYEV